MGAYIPPRQKYWTTSGRWDEAEKTYLYPLTHTGRIFDVLENLLEHYLATREEILAKEMFEKLYKFNCRKIESLNIKEFDQSGSTFHEKT